MADLHRRAVLAAGAAGMAVASPAGANGAGNFDAGLFDTFIDARAGSGSPVFWYSTGTVKAFPSGRTLFAMEGFDAARLMPRQRGSAEAVQLSRKIYVMRDPATNAIVREYEGRRAEPIAYPYQKITYRMNASDVDTFVEQGAAPRIQRIGPVSGMTARRVGDTAVFTAPLFLDIPLPAGNRMQVFENYDFFIHTGPRGGHLREPHQLSWMRTGPLPAWAGGGPSVMHLITWRVERFADLPASIRTVIEAEYPLWRAPPADLAEIARLQAGETAR